MDAALGLRHEGVVRHVTDYHAQGFAIVRGVFGAADRRSLAAAFDAVRLQAARHRATFRHGNLLFVFSQDDLRGPVLRFVQWPSRVEPTLARYRTDARLLALLAPLIGRDLKQVTNSIIWKRPGVESTGFAYHQDCRFRRPASAFANLATAIVHCAIAVDPHDRRNGCMRMMPGSHRLGDLALGVDRGVYDSTCDERTLVDAGLDPAALVDIVLDAGDVVLWHPYTVHGSHPNRSRGDRRSYLNAYVRAEGCARGEWAFRDGEPCGLGAPQLVQYEALYQRPEAHYVDGPPHPFEKP
jgi:ectoine hydroxylase-related dioxygenase (phytanoyl-CoA dioxygenase family)